MSVETDTFADDLATTSLIPTSANNAATTRSRLKNDSQNSEQHKVHFNLTEDGEKRQKVSTFIREQPRPKTSTSTDSGFASRLSMAIRRSLRLGPKQRSTAVQSPTPKDEHRTFRFGEDKNAFTSFTDLRKEPCDLSYGSIAELQYMIQMNRKNQIKKFVRHNDWPISHEIRVDLWRVLCNYKDFETNKILYQKQISNLFKTGVKAIQPSFLLHSDGIVVEDHGLKQQGAIALQRVLIVIECERPELRFVPILYPLCSMLLHYLKPDEAFSAMLRFLNTSTNFLIQSDVSLYASFHTILALLKKHRRSAYNFLKRRVGTNDEVKLAEVFRLWSEWIFKYLPFDYLVRIIDCYLVEGHKMLLRVALSLVYLWYKQRVKSAPTASAATTPEARVEEISTQIIVLCQNCPVSIQTLLDMGFAIRNFKHSTINSLQKQFEDKYRQDVHEGRSGKSIVHAQVNNMYTAAFESVILDGDSACELMSALPSRFQLETPVLLFRLSEHGASFTQLWSQIDDAEQSLMIIRTTEGEIFGAYCSSSWAERKDVRERAKTRYFGTGESFVFKQPKGQLYPMIYNWVGRNSDDTTKCSQQFMTAGERFLIIGSGGTGDAIAIRDELTHGLSFACETFGSTPLVSNTAFDIDELEVFNVISAVAI